MGATQMNPLQRFGSAKRNIDVTSSYGKPPLIATVEK
jgi:hypothetical protein